MSRKLFNNGRRHYNYGPAIQDFPLYNGFLSKSQKYSSPLQKKHLRRFCNSIQYPENYFKSKTVENFNNDYVTEFNEPPDDAVYPDEWYCPSFEAKPLREEDIPLVEQALEDIQNKARHYFVLYERERKQRQKLEKTAFFFEQGNQTLVEKLRHETKKARLLMEKIEFLRGNTHMLKTIIQRVDLMYLQLDILVQSLAGLACYMAYTDQSKLEAVNTVLDYLFPCRTLDTRLNALYGTTYYYRQELPLHLNSSTTSNTRPVETPGPYPTKDTVSIKISPEPSQTKSAENRRVTLEGFHIHAGHLTLNDNSNNERVLCVFRYDHEGPQEAKALAERKLFDGTLTDGKGSIESSLIIKSFPPKRSGHLPFFCLDLWSQSSNHLIGTASCSFLDPICLIENAVWEIKNSSRESSGTITVTISPLPRKALLPARIYQLAKKTAASKQSSSPQNLEADYTNQKHKDTPPPIHQRDPKLSPSKGIKPKNIASNLSKQQILGNVLEKDSKQPLKEDMHLDQRDLSKPLLIKKVLFKTKVKTFAQKKLQMESSNQEKALNSHSEKATSENTPGFNQESSIKNRNNNKNHPYNKNGFTEAFKEPLQQVQPKVHPRSAQNEAESKTVDLKTSQSNETKKSEEFKQTFRGVDSTKKTEASPVQKKDITNKSQSENIGKQQIKKIQEKSLNTALKGSVENLLETRKSIKVEKEAQGFSIKKPGTVAYKKPNMLPLTKQKVTQPKTLKDFQLKRNESVEGVKSQQVKSEKLQPKDTKEGTVSPTNKTMTINVGTLEGKLSREGTRKLTNTAQNKTSQLMEQKGTQEKHSNLKAKPQDIKRMESSKMKRMESSKMKRMESSKMKRLESSKIKRMESSKIKRMGSSKMNRMEKAKNDSSLTTLQSKKEMDLQLKKGDNLKNKKFIAFKSVKSLVKHKTTDSDKEKIDPLSIKKDATLKKLKHQDSLQTKDTTTLRNLVKSKNIFPKALESADNIVKQRMSLKENKLPQNILDSKTNKLLQSKFLQKDNDTSAHHKEKESSLGKPIETVETQKVLSETPTNSFKKDMFKTEKGDALKPFGLKNSKMISSKLPHEELANIKKPTKSSMKKGTTRNTTTETVPHKLLKKQQIQNLKSAIGINEQEQEAEPQPSKLALPKKKLAKEAHQKDASTPSSGESLKAKTKNSLKTGGKKQPKEYARPSLKTSSLKSSSTKNSDTHHENTPSTPEDKWSRRLTLPPLTISDLKKFLFKNKRKVTNVEEATTAQLKDLQNKNHINSDSKIKGDFNKKKVTKSSKVKSESKKIPLKTRNVFKKS